MEVEGARSGARILRDVAPGVHLVEHSFTNYYLLEDEGGITVVDAGLATGWPTLSGALREIGRGLPDVRALVLTHAHFGHLGFAERARRELGVPVFVHENDAPLTRQPRQYAHERARPLYAALYPRSAPIVVSLLANRAWWPSPVREVRRFGSEAGELPVPGSPRVVFTPGHTLGHAALHLPDRDCVIAGDALVALDPYTALRGPRLVARAATADSERALASLDALAATGARTVLTGHGEPYYRGAQRAAEEARRAGVA